MCCSSLRPRVSVWGQLWQYLAHSIWKIWLGSKFTSHNLYIMWCLSLLLGQSMPSFLLISLLGTIFPPPTAATVIIYGIHHEPWPQTKEKSCQSQQSLGDPPVLSFILGRDRKRYELANNVCGFFYYLG